MSLYDELLVEAEEHAQSISASLTYPMSKDDYQQHVTSEVLRSICEKIEKLKDDIQNTRFRVDVIGGRRQ